MIHVGFWYDYGLKYAGGLNYFRNLLHAIREVRPADVQTTLFIGKDLPPQLENEFGRTTRVVKLDILTRGTFRWFLHRLLYRGIRSQFFVERELRKHRVDVVSHPSMVERLSRRFKLISWIPDFQYLHLPHLFPGIDTDRRTREIRAIHRSSDAVVVSSQNAYQDFGAALADAHPERTHVMPFVSQLHVSEHEPALTQALLEKHGVPPRYFFLPNQFWAHKNHRLAFEALAILKRRGIDVTLVCTGWMKDPNRATTGGADALALREQAQLQSNILLLGSIDYADVIGLMRGCIAVINPSFFEGWSSSVEESKSIGKPIFVSDIPVHREQAHPKAHYFDPNDAEALAALLETAWRDWPGGVAVAAESEARIALQRRTIEFGQQYVSILREVAAREHHHAR